jgi:sterol desaturase/sphingolipid hydroxylase (fatty acid hydroxylase superfamily)
MNAILGNLSMHKVILYAFPFMVTLSVLEAVLVTCRKSGTYHWKGLAISILDLVGRTILIKAVPFSVTAVLFAFAWQHRLTTIPLDSVKAFVLLLLGQELCYYWYHRSSHRIQWFWATHAVHHSSLVLNLASVYRVGWTNRFFSPLLFFTPLVWLGFSPELVALVFTLNLLYQVWIHNTTIPRLGWVEYVLNTPSSHRVHHASNATYLDANYGGVLIIFDRLFGTYVAESDIEPCRYGLVKPANCETFVWTQLHEWMSMARNVRNAKKLTHVYRYLFGVPGWSPGGGETTEQIKRKSQIEARRV